MSWKVAMFLIQIHVIYFDKSAIKLGNSSETLMFEQPPWYWTICYYDIGTLHAAILYALEKLHAIIPTQKPENSMCNRACKVKKLLRTDLKDLSEMSFVQMNKCKLHLLAYCVFA